ncbi:MAG: hypothetical protein H6Q19_955 [Bacteroidetes bacterium]|nr:hypothetical protein [Bacteroidota bacterium]
MRFPVSIILLLSVTLALAQSEPISHASGLIVQKKFKSAYQVLDSADAANQNAEIVIAKTDLLLNHNIGVNNHRVFALNDSAANQSVTQNRPIYVNFPADSILKELIDKYPANYTLHKSLGDYYLDVQLTDEEGWMMSDSALVAGIKDNYLQAYQHNVFDYKSLNGLGYTAILEEDFETAIGYLEQSVKLNKNYPVSLSNLTDAYFATGKFDNALLSAQNAFGLYTENTDKAEAARKIAEIYIEMKQNDKALLYYLKADDLIPNDYLTLIPILKLEMELNNSDYANRTNQIITLAPDNPVVYQDVYKVYSENEKEKEFVDFLESQKVYYRSNVRAQAHIHFYMAVAQYEQDDWVDAKINFEKARNLFRGFFKSNHSVFNVIDSYTNAIRKK